MADVKETAVHAIDPFGVFYKGDPGVDLSNPFVDTYELELDKETGSTKVVKGEPIDFVAQIQTFKDQCGVTAMMRDLAAGRALPSQFGDDGKSGGDFSRSTMISEFVGDLVQAELASAKAKADAESKGIDVNEITKDGVDLDAYITKLVNEKLAVAQTAAAAGIGESK